MVTGSGVMWSLREQLDRSEHDECGCGYRYEGAEQEGATDRQPLDSELVEVDDDPTPAGINSSEKCRSRPVAAVSRDSGSVPLISKQMNRRNIPRTGPGTSRSSVCTPTSPISWKIRRTVMPLRNVKREPSKANHEKHEPPSPRLRWVRKTRKGGPAFALYAIWRPDLLAT